MNQTLYRFFNFSISKPVVLSRLIDWTICFLHISKVIIIRQKLFCFWPRTSGAKFVSFSKNSIICLRSSFKLSIQVCCQCAHDLSSISVLNSAQTSAYYCWFPKMNVTGWSAALVLWVWSSPNRVPITSLCPEGSQRTHLHVCEMINTTLGRLELHQSVNTMHSTD